MKVVLNPRGPKRREADLAELQVPNLWYVAQGLDPQASDMVLETWHLAYDLMENLRSMEGLLEALENALADLEGIMPEYEPSGDREHPGWQTIEDIKAAIAKARGEETNG